MRIQQCFDSLLQVLPAGWPVKKEIGYAKTPGVLFQLLYQEIDRLKYYGNCFASFEHECLRLEDNLKTERVLIQ
jgi:hypothetical protein